MKGISLPIQMIVIVVICVLVLLVVSVFFTGGFGKTASMSHMDALNRGCVLWKAQGCGTLPTGGIPGYDGDGDGTVGGPTDTLAMACQKALGDISPSKTSVCGRYCGCV